MAAVGALGWAAIGATAVSAVSQVYAAEQKGDLIESQIAAKKENQQQLQAKQKKVAEQEAKQRKSVIRGAIDSQGDDSLFDILGSAQV